MGVLSEAHAAGDIDAFSSGREGGRVAAYVSKGAKHGYGVGDDDEQAGEAALKDLSSGGSESKAKTKADDSE